jgi:hypothetical protein
MPAFGILYIEMDKKYQLKMKKSTPLIIIALVAACCSSQLTMAQKPLQYSAEILAADSTKNVFNATIFDRKTGQGTTSNQQGFFSLVVLPGDSIEIRHQSFQSLIVIIPYDVSGEKLSETLYMYPKYINLNQVTIFPFTREQFRTAFIYQNVPHDNLSRAYANMNPAVLRRISKDLPKDGSEQFNMVMHQYASTYYYMGQHPPMNIFNPAAWYEFFKTLQNGGFKNTSDQ